MRYLLLVLCLSLCSACLATPAKPVKITYNVSGSTDSASLTYTNAQGGTEQREVSLPWSVTFEAQDGAFTYISAQNKESSGSIGVHISVNGSIRKSSTSEGGYTIAQADYFCCR